MDPRRLLVFGAVARTGSLAAAARDLGWTQPAVSQHVRALERELRVPLVVRSTRGVSLTEAGRALLAHADAVDARLRAAEAEVAVLAGRPAGTVRLVAFPTAGAALVPGALAALAQRHPDVEVRLTTAEPPEALGLLAAGEADAALVFRWDDEPAPDPGPFVEHDLGGDPARLVLPAGHPLASGDGPAGLADLAGERWAAGCERCRGHLLRAAARAGFSPDVRHSTDDHLIVQALVAAGIAVALLPDLGLGTARHPGVVLRDVTGAGSRRVLLTHHADAGAIPALRALVTALPRLQRARAAGPP